MHSCGLVQFFLPSFWEGRDRHILRIDLADGIAARSEVGLLCRGEAHGASTPIIQILMVVQLEIFSKFPSAALLLPPRGTVVRQVGVGIIVKKTGHIITIFQRTQPNPSIV